jgi:electron transfer flavoprotein alpha subunit
MGEELIMEKILVLVHPEADGSIGRLGLESLAAAASLKNDLAGATLVVGFIGESVEKVKPELAASGAEKILAVTGADFASARYATDASAATALGKASGATIVIAPNTTRFVRALPGATHRLGGRLDTRVTGFVIEGGALRIQRWFYRQRMIATLARVQRPWVILVESGIAAGKPALIPDASIAVEAVAVEVSDAMRRTKVAGRQPATEGEQTIKPDAALLLVAGAGWTKKQADGAAHVKRAEAIIKEFLGSARASLGSSKSLADQTGEGQEIISILSHLNQVGQTGTTPRHPKGLATACHGEEPHVVGWRFINERRAINLDPNCGWAQGKADVLYVADSFAVMEKVNALLKG